MNKYLLTPDRAPMTYQRNDPTHAEIGDPEFTQLVTGTWVTQGTCITREAHPIMDDETKAASPELPE